VPSLCDCSSAFSFSISNFISNSVVCSPEKNEGIHSMPPWGGIIFTPFDRAVKIMAERGDLQFNMDSSGSQ